MDIQASVLLLSGCADNQLSMDGERNGLFTAALRRVYEGSGGRRGYFSFYRKIVKQMPPMQTPSYFLVGAPSPSFEKQAPFNI